MKDDIKSMMMMMMAQCISKFRSRESLTFTVYYFTIADELIESLQFKNKTTRVR